MFIKKSKDGEMGFGCRVKEYILNKTIRLTRGTEVKTGFR